MSDYRNRPPIDEVRVVEISRAMMATVVVGAIVWGVAMYLVCVALGKAG